MHAGRAVLERADGEARRHRVHQAGGAGPDPRAHHELHHTPPVLPQQEPRPRRPRLALRYATPSIAATHHSQLSYYTAALFVISPHDNFTGII